MSNRLRLLGFAVVAVGFLVLLNIGFSAANTLSRLDAVEAERDQWQRPQEILRALGPAGGETIVDLGCGSGYFTLKLAAAARSRGRVIGEDVRWLPLVFLRARTILKGRHNVSLVHVQPADAHLPANGVNAVLILNAYHELSDRRAILGQVRQALVSGGRLVVVDRQPNPANVGVTENGEHEIPVATVEAELREIGFEIAERQERFIESDPDRETWWLLAARKP